MKTMTKLRLLEILESGDYRYAEEHEKCVEAKANCLLRHGAIVPPCRVGDIVYEVLDVPGFYGITKHLVTNIRIGLNPLECFLHCKSVNSGSTGVFSNDTFGKSIFFTENFAMNAIRLKLKGDVK